MSIKKAKKLLDIALGDGTYSERIQAIDYLGHLGNSAVDPLAKIAFEGFSYSERIKAIELLGDIDDIKVFDALSEIALHGSTYSERKAALDLLKKHLK